MGSYTTIYVYDPTTSGCVFLPDFCGFCGLICILMPAMQSGIILLSLDTKHVNIDHRQPRNAVFVFYRCDVYVIIISINTNKYHTRRFHCKYACMHMFVSKVPCKKPSSM